MPHDTCCCCHLMTAAAIVGVLQTIIVVFEMSTSGLILSKWNEWTDRWNDAEAGVMSDQLAHNNIILKKLQIYEKLELKGGTNITAQAYADLRTLIDDDMQMIRQKAKKINTRNEMIRNGTLNATLYMKEQADKKEDDEKRDLVSDAGQQMYHTYVIAFAAIWLAALMTYSLAFYYRRASFVLPNFIMTIVALIMLFLIIVNMIIMIAYDKKDNDDKLKKLWDKLSDDDDNDDMYKMFKGAFAFTLAVTIIMWILLVIFAVIIQKFHKWLIMGHGMMVFPELTTVRHHPMKPGSATFEVEH